MKIKLVSDLHLEFGDYTLTPDDADVLVLAGDIVVAEDLHRHGIVLKDEDPTDGRSHRFVSSQRFINFFARASEMFSHVIYIAGNHEFYHGKFPGYIKLLKEFASQWPNVHMLENESVEIDDVVFVGSSLWTNMNNHDPVTMYQVGVGMNDFRLIVQDQLGFSKLRPAHIAGYHATCVQKITQLLESNSGRKVVMVTHHCPTFQSINERYRNEYHMNGAYASELSELILDHPQIKYWFHGHVHSPVDYTVGDTRVISNPKGYPGEPTEFNPNLVMEV